MTGFLDMAGAASFLCRSPRWIRTRLHEIPHYKAGQLLFRHADLEQYMERFRIDPQGIDIQKLVKRICGRPVKRTMVGRENDRSSGGNVGIPGAISNASPGMAGTNMRAGGTGED